MRWWRAWATKRQWRPLARNVQPQTFFVLAKARRSQAQHHVCVCVNWSESNGFRKQWPNEMKVQSARLRIICGLLSSFAGWRGFLSVATLAHFWCSQISKAILLCRRVIFYGSWRRVAQVGRARTISVRANLIIFNGKTRSIRTMLWESRLYSRAVYRSERKGV